MGIWNLAEEFREPRGDDVLIDRDGKATLALLKLIREWKQQVDDHETRITVLEP